MKLATIAELNAYAKDFEYLVEALHLMDSMDLEVDHIIIDSEGYISFSVTIQVNTLSYKVPTTHGFNLYTAFRALYRLYNEGTAAEDNALQSAVFDILYQDFVSIK